MINPEGTKDSVEIIDRHLAQFFDLDEIMVLHEKDNARHPSDLFIVQPNKDRDYHLLLTCGMSNFPMKVPEYFNCLKHAEIMMLLPRDWPLNYEALSDEAYYWPVRAILQLSKYPRLNNTWLGFGHTVPLDQSRNPGHRFDSLLLLESIHLSEDFTYTEKGEKEIHFYSAFPIYKEEREFKLKHGTDKLLDLFERYDIEEIMDVNRRRVCQ